MNLKHAHFLIRGERNLVKNELDLEDTVKEEMLSLFDRVIESSTGYSGIIDVARTVAFTTEKTKSLDATRAVCQPLFCDDKSRVRKYTHVVLNIFHRNQFGDPELTTKFGETFERHLNLDTIHDGWHEVMINAYASNSDVEARVMTQIDLNSHFPIDEQEKVINFIKSTINKFYNKENLNDRKTLNSVFRTLEAYHQSPLCSDVIDTLEIMVLWHRSCSAMKDVSDCLYHHRNNSNLKKMAEMIREGKDKTYSVTFANLFMNCSDHHNINRDNLMCYFDYVRPNFYVGKLGNNLPLRTINSLVETYDLVLSFFINDPSSAASYFIREKVKSTFFKVLNKKVKLGNTDQEKIQILDEWSTNAYRLIRNNPEKMNYNAFQMIA